MQKIIDFLRAELKKGAIFYVTHKSDNSRIAAPIEFDALHLYNENRTLITDYFLNLHKNGYTLYIKYPICKYYIEIGINDS